MDFELTREQRMIQQTVREYMQRKIAPVAEQIDREDRFPEGIWKSLGDLGVLGIGIPEEYGGSGMDILTLTLVTEQIARICPALALSVTAHVNLCAHNIDRNGTEYQKKKYLPGLCSGDLVGCLGLTEPDAGSDAVGIQTMAVNEDRHYRINGSKTFITNALDADVALVYTKTDMEKRSKGITAFILEKGMAGFTRTGKIEKMGHRGSGTGQLIFNDCRASEENVLGRVNQGIQVMMTGLDIERVVVSGIALGIGEASLELALKYAKTRYQFGQPIGSFQLIKAKLADMYTEMTAAQCLVYKAAELAGKVDKGGKGTPIHKLAAAAVLLSSEAARRAANESLQIHGGYGYTLEYPINRFYRDVKLMEIGAGTSEIRRLVIGDELISSGTGF